MMGICMIINDDDDNLHYKSVTVQDIAKCVRKLSPLVQKSAYFGESDCMNSQFQNHACVTKVVIGHHNPYHTGKLET